MENISQSSDKSYLVNFLLAIFLGNLAVDRFYLGKIGTAILKLITFGGLGIWVIVDIILSFTGSSTSKDGKKVIGNKKDKKIAAFILIVWLLLWILSLIVLIIVFMSVPALQKSQRDTARKNDIAYIASDVVYYQTLNQGVLPSSNELNTSNLAIVESISSTGNPTKESALYTIGNDCEGMISERNFAIYIQLENGSEYCTGS